MQEEEEHQKGEHGSEGERLNDVGDGIADEAGLRRGDGELDVGVLDAELLEYLVHPLGHLHGVGARLLI